MSAEQLLSELRALDIRLSAESGRLRCSAPKGRLTRELEQRIAALKPELILALQASAAPSTSILRRAHLGTPPPLSFAQERFWFLQSLDPDSTAYNITASRQVPEPLDPAILSSALRDLLQRHEILRTNFPEIDGFPVQVVHDAMSPEIPFHDFSSLSPPESSAAAASLIQELSGQPFDLASGPLFRIALIRTAEGGQFIVLTVHHIVCDAWSIGIFFTELKTLYEAYAAGRTPDWPRPTLQYADYAAWERARQTSGLVAPQIEYWKGKLGGAPRYLDLPLDHPRPAAVLYKPKLQRFELGASASESLKALSRREGATPFMVLLAIFQTLLFRYTQQDDVLVGTPVSTRTQPELEQLMGCLINTHVLRTRFPSGLTTRELLAQVRGTVLESLHHADVPFETLINELVTERDLSRSPLFQVAFILQNTPGASEYNVLSGGTTFDMTLYMWESNGLIGGCVEYNAALFDEETLACFAVCFQTLAAEMASQPDIPVEQLPLLTRAQEAEWFEQYNGPSTPIPPFATHEWIEHQATETPNTVAVVCGQEHLTYRELSVRSNRLAQRLRAMGVGTGSLVALCLDRSSDLVVAPLAVWKAGGAYLPLDPEYPSHRLAFMLEDSAAGVLVTESRLLDRLPSGISRVICLDRDRQLLEHESPDPLAPSATSGDLAYVIYTSGSTGKPKGVEITHHSLVNFLSSMQRQPGMAPSDRLLAVTTLSFDIAGLELYLPLVSGARVVIAPRAAAFDGAALAGLLRDAAITVMQATPVTWRLLLESGWKGTPGLKILCGGEALTQDLAEQLAATGAELWNLYGPTETTIWSVIEHVDVRRQRISIGRPIANTQVCVWDEHRHALPPGVPGELYIGGDGVARAYLHRPELTAERFVDHPDHPGERLYRTGDLVRRLPGGGLEYIGRADHQVKLRGFRIELGEIETVLKQQPGVAQAVVVVREDQPGDQRLIAYVRTSESAGLDSAALRRALLAVLPEYMMPAAFVLLDTFPLTPNRKIDRKALLAHEYRPNFSASALDSAAGDPDGLSGIQDLPQYVPPSNHVEFAMAEIWREVLGVERVGVLDNFFELGGHSLSAVRLVSRMRSAMGMDLPLRGIFIDPTIASLASHISYDPTIHGYRYSSEIPRWNCLVPAQPRGTRPPFFFVAGYQNPDDTLLVLSRLIPHLGMDQPVFGFRPRWIENSNHDYSSVEEMAREYLAELRAVQPKGPYLLGGHCVGGIAALEIANLLQQEGEEVRLMVFLDTERPTRLRIFYTDLYWMRQRASHMAEVVSDIVHARNGSRAHSIRDLLRRKLGIAPSQEDQAADSFYQSKVRYRRLLYSHTPKQYPGRITLIVNEEQARYDKDLGWTGIPEGGLDVHTMPGNHTTILTDHGKEVAEVILRSIREALAESDRQEDRIEVKAG